MQTSVFYKKRICFVTAILLILIHLFTPIATYADNSSKIEDLYAQAEKKLRIKETKMMVKKIKGLLNDVRK